MIFTPFIKTHHPHRDHILQEHKDITVYQNRGTSREKPTMSSYPPRREFVPRDGNAGGYSSRTVFGRVPTNLHLGSHTYGDAVAPPSSNKDRGSSLTIVITPTRSFGFLYHVPGLSRNHLTSRWKAYEKVHPAQNR